MKCRFNPVSIAGPLCLGRRLFLRCPINGRPRRRRHPAASPPTKLSLFAPAPLVTPKVPTIAGGQFSASVAPAARNTAKSALHWPARPSSKPTDRACREDQPRQPAGTAPSEGGRYAREDVVPAGGDTRRSGLACMGNSLFDPVFSGRPDAGRDRAQAAESCSPGNSGDFEPVGRQACADIGCLHHHDAAPHFRHDQCCIHPRLGQEGFTALPSAKLRHGRRDFASALHRIPSALEILVLLPIEAKRGQPASGIWPGTGRGPRYR